ncbi:MAG: trigger factor [Dehalococcoidia bacterium]
MKVTQEEVGPLEVALTIELEPSDLEPFLERAYRKAVQRVQVPGFRKGKAPRPLVERFVGREALLQEVLEPLVLESVAQAIEQKGLEAFDEPRVEQVELEPVSIKALVPLKPVVELGDYMQVHREVEPVEVSGEQVQEVVEQLRWNAAPWQPADRPIQFGDLVSLDVEGSVDGRKVTDEKGVEYLASQENQAPLPGFATHLEGLQKDATKEFTLPVPEDYADRSLAGKECRFTVKVLEVKEKELPELNDEFAKGVGEGFEGLEAMQQRIAENLRQERERGARHRLHEEVLQQVVDDARVELPSLLIERELDRLLEEQLQALQGQADLETYLQQAGKSEEEMRQELRPLAQERLTRSLVLRRLVEVEGIEVTEQEVEAEMASLKATGPRGESLHQAFSTPQGRRSLENMVLTRKVLQRLEEIATGTASQASEGTPAAQETEEGGTSQ